MKSFPLVWEQSNTSWFISNGSRIKSTMLWPCYSFFNAFAGLNTIISFQTAHPIKELILASYSKSDFLTSLKVNARRTSSHGYYYLPCLIQLSGKSGQFPHWISTGNAHWPILSLLYLLRSGPSISLLPSLSHSETALSLLTSTAVSTVFTRSSSFNDLQYWATESLSKGPKPRAMHFLPPHTNFMSQV